MGAGSLSSHRMSVQWRYAVAVSVVLALCCVVTIHMNDESIQIAAGVEHAGMLYEHDEVDSDELSEADRTLIQSVQSHFDPPVQLPKDRAKKSKSDRTTSPEAEDEDEQDQLSPAQQALIRAASAGSGLQHFAVKAPPARAKAKAKVAGRKSTTELTSTSESRHQFVSSDDEDELSEEQKHLIAAAHHEDDDQQPVAKAMPHSKVEKKVEKKVDMQKVVKAQLQKVMKSKVQKIVKHTKRVSSSNDDSDALSADEKALISAARSKPDHAGVSVRSHSHGLSNSRQHLQKVETDFTPAEKKLIHNHSSKAPVVVKSHKSMMQQIEATKAQLQVSPKSKSQADKKSMKMAMEKITKSAAQQAVVAQTKALKINVPAAESVLGVTTSHAAVTNKMAHSGLDARSVILGETHAAAEEAADAQAFAASPATPIASLSTSPPVVSIEQARTREIKKLKQNLKQIKVPDTWEARLAEADRHAQMMAAHQALPLSADEIARAHMMRSRLAAEDNAIAQANQLQADHEDDYLDPDEASLLNARSTIMDPSV